MLQKTDRQTQNSQRKTTSTDEMDKTINWTTYH